MSAGKVSRSDDGVTEAFRVTSGAQSRGLLALPSSPAATQLRWFAISTAGVLALVGVVVTFIAVRASSSSASTAWIPWCAATVAVAALGGFWPTVMRIPYRALAVLTFPIGWLVSHLVLATIYYGLVTPIGLAMRLSGRDNLDLRIEPDRDTYWTPRAGDGSTEGYFRQF